MIKQFLSKGAGYFICLFACLWLSMLSLASVLVIRFIAPKGSIEESVILTLLMTVVMLIGMCVGAYRSGYKKDVFDIKMILIPMIIALLLHMVYAFLFSFMVYAAGPAYYLGNAIYLAQGNLSLSAPVPDSYVLPCVLGFDLIYIAVVIVGEYFGVKKRKSDRDQLLSKSNNNN